MKNTAVAVLSVVIAAAVTGTACAIPVTPVAQSNAPVRVESCSALALDTTTTPEYGQTQQTTLMDASGHITSAGPAVTVDQRIPMTQMYDSTQVFAAARAVNRSNKIVSAVVYQFELFGRNGKQVGLFFGPRSGAFAANERIEPYGLGAASPWSTSLTQPTVASAACLVAYVRFSDGTSWQSPLATLPPTLESAP
ncbi:MAG TPA: hypothetical protein VJP85_13950 [Candidatus Baltobacteraceae bacterium]|nr:hypothetical protein [Candidatus Baltobacteraceae bacterium]